MLRRPSSISSRPNPKPTQAKQASTYFRENSPPLHPPQPRAPKSSFAELHGENAPPGRVPSPAVNSLIFSLYGRYSSTSSPVRGSTLVAEHTSQASGGE